MRPAALASGLLLALFAAPGPTLAQPGPVRVLVWDEQQPEQRQAYRNFLGNEIAGHLRGRPGLAVRSVRLDDPGQGLAGDALDKCDVLIWWGHLRQREVKPEVGRRIVERVKQGKLSLIALHSAHWSTPFIEAMNERAIADAVAGLTPEERKSVKVVPLPPLRYAAPRREDPLTPSTRRRTGSDGKTVLEVFLPICCFPAYRPDGKPSHIKTLLPGHPIARGLPARFDLPHTEMYDEPFHVPPPDQVVFEERWDAGEHFRSGCVWRLGKGRVFYFRPGHETYAVYLRPEPRQILENAVRWLAAEQKAPAAAAIFAPGATLKVEAGGGAGGEGPAWHPELGVLSCGNGHIYQLTRDGKSRIYRKGAGTNGLQFDQQGRLVACDAEHRRITRTGPDGKLLVLTDRYAGKRYNTPNDLTIDSRGRIYFSDPRYGPRDGMEIRDGQGRTIEGVYRIDPDGKVVRVLGRELERPNGLLVSAGDRYLYVADNNNNAVGGARKLWRFNLSPEFGDVDVASKKLIYDWGQGRGPDGLKQDVKGRLYVAAGLNRPNPPYEPAKDVKGGIYVLSPEGKLLAFLPVPTDEVTNCCFGGDDLRTLYITGGGTLYSIRTTTPGRVVWPPVKAHKGEGAGR